MSAVLVQKLQESNLAGTLCTEKYQLVEPEACFHTLHKYE